jgi:hypothetical protein
VPTQIKLVTREKKVSTPFKIEDDKALFFMCFIVKWLSFELVVCSFNILRLSECRTCGVFDPFVVQKSWLDFVPDPTNFINWTCKYNHIINYINQLSLIDHIQIDQSERGFNNQLFLFRV